MMIEGRVGRWVGGVLALGLAVGIAGCDYWPPALQTQIEQLQSELQAASAEKVQLQNQLASVTKAKDDLQTQVDELSRAGRDKSDLIQSLQNTVTSLQARLAKSTKAAAAKASSKKPAAKTKKKAPAKKKAATKSAPVR
ncbi:hypothetical protein [Petrachloros mirabilis]